MTAAETTALRPGHEISRVIKGGWQLAGDHGEVERDRAIADMQAFVDAGITTFDCADIYTGVEVMIGDFIGRLRRQQGSEAARRVTVHTKFVPDIDRLQTLRADEIENIIDRSLQRLQIDRLHLVQFHWWDLAIGNAVDAMGVLDRLRDKGKINNLGVTNLDTRHIASFVDAGIDVASAQVQYSVLDRRPANGLADWAASHDLQLLCYGSLAGGFLTEQWLGRADPGFEFDNRSLVKYRLIIDEFGPWALFQDLLRVLKAIGDRHGVALSSVATRFVLEQPRVAAAIVGARYAHHLPETLQVFRFALDQEDRQTLARVTGRAGGPAGEVYGLERDRNSAHGRIMKYTLNRSPTSATLAQQQE